MHDKQKTRVAGSVYGGRVVIVLELSLLCGDELFVEHIIVPYKTRR